MRRASLVSPHYNKVIEITNKLDEISGSYGGEDEWMKTVSSGMLRRAVW
jgi:hypothetical protein